MSNASDRPRSRRLSPLWTLRPFLAPYRLTLLAAMAALVIAAAAFVRGMSSSIRSSGSVNNIVLLGAGSEESIERSEVEQATAGLVEASLSGIRTRAGVASGRRVRDSLIHAMRSPLSAAVRASSATRA